VNEANTEEEGVASESSDSEEEEGEEEEEEEGEEQAEEVVESLNVREESVQGAHSEVLNIQEPQQPTSSEETEEEESSSEYEVTETESFKIYFGSGQHMG